MMMRVSLRRSLGALAYLGGSLWFAAACTSDEDAGQTGPDGSAHSGTGGAHSGGTAGAATGGKASGGTASGGAGPIVDASVDGTMSGGAATIDSGRGRDGDGADADDGEYGDFLILGGQDGCLRCTETEVVSIDLARGRVIGRQPWYDLYVHFFASGGHGFAVVSDALYFLTPTLEITARIDLHGHFDASRVGGLSNVIYAHPAGKPPKAYAAMLDRDPDGNGIEMIDPEAQRVTSFFRLTDFRDPSIGESTTSVVDGFYDGVTARTYFVLQRWIPDAVDRCPSVPSTLIAMDSQTDDLIDLNGAAPGVGISLSLNADRVTFDKGSRRMFAAGGCLEGDAGGSHGVEMVNIDTLTSKVVFTSSASLVGLNLLGPDSAVLTSSDGSTSTSNLWTVGAPTLGMALPGLPEETFSEGPDSLIYVEKPGVQARVLRYTVSTRTATPVIEDVYALHEVPTTPGWRFLVSPVLVRAADL